MAITSFSGENAFLSNFYPCKVHYLAVEYPSVEHALQASKSDEMHIRFEFSYISTPEEARKRGQTLKPHKGWHRRIVHSFLREKFHIEPLLSMLLATGDETLIDGKYWDDSELGGRNILGKYLMQVRFDINEELRGI